MPKTKAEMDKAKLMILLQIRGKCSEYEHKFMLFDAHAVHLINSESGSLYKAMLRGLQSMDKSIGEWIEEMESLLLEWEALTDEGH